jgi:hypothetical protein
MLLTDAVNEIIMPGAHTLKGVSVECKDNALTLTDEFGPMTQMFTEHDPELKNKVSQLWSSFLKRQSTRLLERMNETPDNDKEQRIRHFITEMAIKGDTIGVLLNLSLRFVPMEETFDALRETMKDLQDGLTAIDKEWTHIVNE